MLVTDGTAAARPVARRGAAAGTPASSKRRGALVASSAALVLGAGVVIVAVGVPGSHAAPVLSAQQAAVHKPAAPLQVLSVTPAAGARSVNGAAAISVRFSAPLAAGTPMPRLSPSIAGSWQVQGDTAVFTPAVGYVQDSKVTLTIPAGMISVAGASAGAGGRLGSGVTESFTTGSFSTLRLQQLLAQLGYLPLTWISRSQSAINPHNANAELSAAYDAPEGQFGWAGDYPSSLTDQWIAGRANILDVGAIRAFESVQGLTMDGVAGRAVWSDLFAAVAEGKRNANGYSYALANQNSPETLTVWHNGRVVLKSPANTGIAASPTVDGTFPVYLKYYFTYMKGTNPDGTPYDDPVYYANYFNGGDAVHQFPRSGYGWYQSLGCVELPWDAAETAYSYLYYGSLVTVTGPVA